MIVNGRKENRDSGLSGILGLGFLGILYTSNPNCQSVDSEQNMMPVDFELRAGQTPLFFFVFLLLFVRSFDHFNFTSSMEPFLQRKICIKTKRHPTPPPSPIILVKQGTQLRRFRNLFKDGLYLFTLVILSQPHGVFLLSFFIPRWNLSGRPSKVDTNKFSSYWIGSPREIMSVQRRPGRRALLVRVTKPSHYAIVRCTVSLLNGKSAPPLLAAIPLAADHSRAPSRKWLLVSETRNGERVSLQSA